MYHLPYWADYVGGGGVGLYRAFRTKCHGCPVPPTPSVPERRSGPVDAPAGVLSLRLGLPYTSGRPGTLRQAMAWSCIVLAVSLAAVGVAAPAVAAEADDAVPKLTIGAPETMEFESDLFAAETATVSGMLLVANGGAVDATALLTPHIVGGTCGSSDAPSVTLESSHTVDVPANSVKPMPMDLQLPSACAGRKIALVLTADRAAPATTEIAVTRRLDDDFYWLPLILALILSLVTVLVAMVMIAMRTTGKWTDIEVKAGSSWSFKDSWLTNVSAVGAVLAAVLAASGFLDEVAPGLSTMKFLGLGLLFGGMVLIGPLVYGALSRWKIKPASDSEPSKVESVGTVGGLTAASAVTLWGVYGQLCTLLALDVGSPGDLWTRAVLALLLFLAIGIVFVYGVRSLVHLAAPEGKRGAPATRGLVTAPEASATL